MKVMTQRSKPTAAPLLRIFVGRAGVLRVEGAPDERQAAFTLCAKLMPEIERLNRATRKFVR